MKGFLLKVGLLVVVALSLFSHEAFAEFEWASNCSQYGEVTQNENPSLQHVNCLLTNAAIAASIPPEVVKAVATQESGATETSRIWSQFTYDGEPLQE